MSYLQSGISHAHSHFHIADVYDECGRCGRVVDPSAEETRKHSEYRNPICMPCYRIEEGVR